MSAVFGYATVTKVAKLNKNFVHIVYDEELKDKQILKLSTELPIGTKLYWEFNCQDRKTRWMLL